MLSNKKDQEIIVDNSPLRESMGQSSDSTPILPYSHGQAVLPTSTSSPSISSITSSPASAPQNGTFSAGFLLFKLSLPFFIATCLILLLILTLYYLLHWVPLYMATLFLLFILIQPLYLVPLFHFLSRPFLSNLLSTHGLFLTLFTILSLCMPLLAIPAIFIFFNPFH